MKTLLRCIFLSVLLLTLNRPSSAWAQGTAFTYQGRLVDNGIAFTGSAEFQPTLWDAASGGGQVAANSPASVIVGVTNGLFALPLEFGGTPFATGAERWLQLEVRTSIGAFTMLSPRQQLTAAPYAMTAGNLTGPVAAGQLSGTVPSASLGGTYSSAITLDNTGNSFSGSGAGLRSLNASQLTGGTIPDARLSANVARREEVWLLGGNAVTKVGTNSLGTTDNQPLELKVNNTRGWRLEPTLNDADHSDIVNVVGGSPANAVRLGVYGATISGGGAVYYSGVTGTNRVDADFGTIGGGWGNTIQPNAYSSTIGGGWGNTIQPDASASTIAGGLNNTIQTNAYSSTIGGGKYNTIQTNAYSSTIGGGSFNTILINASYASIPGGRYNSATNYAFAAGNRAKANHTGAFVWADSTAADFASTDNDQVSFRCAGGVRFASGSGGANQTVSWTPGSASWSFTSDRATKEGFTPVDGQQVLEKVASLPITEWSYLGYPQRHIGPMAQDFHAQFPLNESDTTLNDADLHGVALAAIQGLNQKVEDGRQKSEDRIQKLEVENAALKQRLEKLEFVLAQQNRGQW